MFGFASFGRRVIVTRARRKLQRNAAWPAGLGIGHVLVEGHDPEKCGTCSRPVGKAW